ncbi:F-box domain-containing protein [Mycena sanguinolenta]|uniref:F-box domain-containing protein n=1 Tax=Mycena sanguinolenta TaxID=230812 RepID=A0A8H6YIG3_9AGAR|nr:F-box domain-containing protein [Mycena sanguinolenta]
MANLMHCMPPDLFEFGDNGAIRLLRPILAADWERPLVYMRRIRQLHCQVPMPAAVSALFTSFPGDAGSLLPKLTSLRWRDSWRGGESPSIQMLLSPKLTSLSISAPLPNAMLSAIPRTCPTLKDLDVYFLDIVYGVDRSALSTCLRDLHSLESVQIVVPDLAALEHLGQLPGLESLTARLPDDLSLRLVAPLRFIALRSLALRSNIEPVTDFFQRCSGVPLENIVIELDLSPTAAAIDRLHTALREGCSHTSLLSLDISIQDDDLPATGDAYTINVQSFRILFCFVNITSIRITSCVGFSIDDQGLKEVVLIWPQIRELRLSLTPWYTDLQLRPKLSLRCLSILAEHCRALTDLEIMLDATVVPEPDPNLGNPPMTSPALCVARYISAIFPSVSKLTTYRTDCDNDDPDELEVHAEAIAHHRLWMEVAEQLPILTAIRNEERLWAQVELGTQ